MKKTALTTIDNPFSPFDEYDAWYHYDVSAGHHASSFLARIVKVSDQMSESDYDSAVEEAIDEIISQNVSGMFLKVTKEFENLD